MTYGDDDNFVFRFVEDNSPIADTEPRSIAATKALDVTFPSRCELGQPLIDATPHISGKLDPLSRTR